MAAGEADYDAQFQQPGEWVGDGSDGGLIGS
jgi:hypothetical protein